MFAPRALNTTKNPIIFFVQLIYLPLLSAIR